MKGFTAMAALAAVSSVLAVPSVTKPLAPRQSSAVAKATVPVTVKGNGNSICKPLKIRY